MNTAAYSRALTLARRASAVVCVVLALFIGFVAAVHSHPDNSRADDRACSVCALAHAGVVPVAFTAPVPVFANYALHLTRAASPRSLLLVTSLYIRPPPVV
jgi:hypothetical protein